MCQNRARHASACGVSWAQPGKCEAATLHKHYSFHYQTFTLVSHCIYLLSLLYVGAFIPWCSWNRLCNLRMSPSDQGWNPFFNFFYFLVAVFGKNSTHFPDMLITAWLISFPLLGLFPKAPQVKLGGVNDNARPFDTGLFWTWLSSSYKSAISFGWLSCWITKRKSHKVQIRFKGILQKWVCRLRVPVILNKSSVSQEWTPTPSHLLFHASWRESHMQIPYVILQRVSQKHELHVSTVLMGSYLFCPKQFSSSISSHSTVRAWFED